MRRRPSRHHNGAHHRQRHLLRFTPVTAARDVEAELGVHREDRKDVVPVHASPVEKGPTSGAPCLHQDFSAPDRVYTLRHLHHPNSWRATQGLDGRGGRNEAGHDVLDKDAPEIPSASAAIRRLLDEGCRKAEGHSERLRYRSPVIGILILQRAGGLRGHQSTGLGTSTETYYGDDNRYAGVPSYGHKRHAISQV